MLLNSSTLFIAAEGMPQAILMHSDGLSCARFALGCDPICMATHAWTRFLFWMHARGMSGGCEHTVRIASR